MKAYGQNSKTNVNSDIKIYFRFCNLDFSIFNVEFTFFS